MSCSRPLIRERHTGRIVGSIRQLEALESKYINNPEYQLIPCGVCKQCRIAYSKQWAARCTLETMYHKPETNWFITLTYDQDEVPTIDKETGEFTRGNQWIIDVFEDKKIISHTLTLWPKDVTDFLKRLRRQIEYHKIGDKIRYYLCGEYGGQTLRPHYHILIYGLTIPDLQYFKTVRANEYFLSEWLAKIWGHGHIIIGRVNYESSAYVSRYVLKKQMGKDQNGISTSTMFGEYGIHPEFTRMSLKPGIGGEYFEEHKKEIYTNDEIIIPGNKKAIKMKPPKRYDRWMEIEEPEIIKEIKEKREEIAKQNLETKLKKTKRTYVEILKAEEEAFDKKFKNLRSMQE